MTSPTKAASIRATLRQAIVRRDGEEFWHAHDLAAASGLRRLQSLDSEGSALGNGLLNRFERLLLRRGVSDDPTVAVRTEDGFLVGFDGAELLCTLLATELAADHIVVVEQFLEERRKGSRLPEIPDIVASEDEKYEDVLARIVDLHSDVDKLKQQGTDKGLIESLRAASDMASEARDASQSALEVAAGAQQEMNKLPDLVKHLVRLHLAEALGSALGAVTSETVGTPASATQVDAGGNDKSENLPSKQPFIATPVRAPSNLAEVQALHPVAPPVLRVAVRYSKELPVGEITGKLNSTIRGQGWREAFNALREVGLITVTDNMIEGHDPTGGELFGLNGSTEWWRAFLTEVVEPTEDDNDVVLVSELWEIWDQMRDSNVPHTRELFNDAVQFTLPQAKKKGPYSFGKLRWTESGCEERNKIKGKDKDAPFPVSLTDEAVAQMVSMASNGSSQREIGEKFGVAQPRVSLAIRQWKDRNPNGQGDMAPETEAPTTREGESSAPSPSADITQALTVDSGALSQKTNTPKEEMDLRAKKFGLNKRERQLVQLILESKDGVTSFQAINHRMDRVKMHPTQRAKVPHILADLARRGVIFSDPVNNLWSAHRMI